MLFQVKYTNSWRVFLWIC